MGTLMTYSNRPESLASRCGVWAGAALVVSLVALPISAGPPNAKGRVTGAERLVADVYVEAARPEARRWNWREPSPAVPQQFRALAPNISREICVVAFNSARNSAPPAPLLVRVTGGRTNPAMLVVAPGTSLRFQNDDPFPHRLVVTGQTGWRAEMASHVQREWKASDNPGVTEFRDELFPSVRTFVVVDPGVVQSVYPARDGSFAFSLAAGSYVLKAFFSGKQVGKDVGFEAKERSVLELKEAVALTETAK
jgi:hypothetical protein